MAGDTRPDLERIESKLAFIRSQVALLSALLTDEERLNRDLSDPYRSGAVKYALQTAVEAVIDLAYHLAAKVYHQAPESAVDAMRILHSQGLLRDAELAFLIPMVRFRNKVVHGYLTVDPEELRGVLRNHLGDFAVWEEIVRRSLESARGAE